MNKKLLIMTLTVFTLLTLNICAAQEIDNSTDVADELSICDESVLEVSNDTQVVEVPEDNQVLEAPNIDTHLDVASKTNFDVIGDYFKVKLSDNNNNPISNVRITFTVNNANYNVNTDSSGFASLQLRLNDGTYNIVSGFGGNSVFKASSIATTITMSNTRVVDAGLSNSQIQNIIDNAKANNVILFKGKAYSDINLVITKSLTLLSNVGTTLKSGSSDPVITIKGKGASLTTLNGFKIQGEGDGVKVDGSDYVKIISNTISGKGNGIVSLNTKYLNITKNDVVKNSKSGISVANSNNVYIFDNKISNNANNGIEVAKSNNVYIHGNTISENKNGIYLAKKINGINYDGDPSNVHISKNTITKNSNDGIFVFNAGENLNIKSNNIEENHGNGISLAHVQSNTIQSNVITENWEHGIQFFDNYVKPDNQDISYNAIYGNLHVDVEAKETYYSEYGHKLDIGDNWYTDYSGVCPKISTNNIKFTVTQIGPNKYQAMFVDSNGNIASLLPDRTLTYTTNNGQKITISIKGGAGVFTVDANDGDLVRATVDNSKRDNIHDVNTKSSKEINGESPKQSYPSIPQYELYDDIGKANAGNNAEGYGNGDGNGNGDGDGTGQGTGGNTNQGNGKSSQESNDNTGNSTHSQNMDPSNAANNQANQVSQPESSQTTSQASASDAGRASDANSGSQQSVVKQIVIDEDEFFKITGISLIILLMILTIGFYYRDDIREMKSKM